MNLESVKNNIEKQEIYPEYIKEIHKSILKHNQLLIPFMLLVFIYYVLGDFLIWNIPVFAILRLPGIITCILLITITYSKLRTNRQLVIVVNNLHCISLLFMGFGLVLIGPEYDFKGIISCILLIVASHFFIKGYKSIILLYSIGILLAIGTFVYSYFEFTTYDHAEMVGLITIFFGIVILSFNNEKTRFNEFYFKSNLVEEKDKTHRLYLETQTQNAQLYRINKQLDVAFQKLEQADKAKNKFFSIIAHDLRSPFSSVVSLIEELKVNLHEYSLDDIESRIRIIEESTKSTLTFLNNLLYWASSQLNGIQIKKDVYPLKHIVNQSITPYLNAAGLKNITVNQNIDTELKVIVDEKTISVVISNLFNNAIKYTPKGGEITIFSEVRDSKIFLSIKDSGIGMDASILSQLFILDKNVSRNGTENEKGSGLGLILSSEFLRYNDGGISVESQENIGSCFSIYLPLLLE